MTRSMSGFYNDHIRGARALPALLTWYTVSLSFPCNSVKSASGTMKWSFCFMVHTLPAQSRSMNSWVSWGQL